MKKILALIAIFFVSTSLLLAKDVYVKGYTKSNGTYVAPHYRSSPDSTVRNNYSYKGNNNPYTGETGDNYYRSSPSSDYYGTTPSVTKSPSYNSNTYSQPRYSSDSQYPSRSSSLNTFSNNGNRLGSTLNRNSQFGSFGSESDE